MPVEAQRGAWDKVMSKVLGDKGIAAPVGKKILEDPCPRYGEKIFAREGHLMNFSPRNCRRKWDYTSGPQRK